MSTDQTSHRHPPSRAADSPHGQARAVRAPRESIVLDGALFWGELTRTHGALDAARLGRDAAELSREHAEAAQHVAEGALAAAWREIVQLREQVEFLEEQVRSTRAYLADVTEESIAELVAERAALLEEVGILDRARATDADLDPGCVTRGENTIGESVRGPHHKSVHS
jgi:hypothetical protein